MAFAVGLEEGGIASFSSPFMAAFMACQAVNVIHQSGVQDLGYLQQNVGENRRR
jgi:hypothetical protein